MLREGDCRGSLPDQTSQSCRRENEIQEPYDSRCHLSFAVYYQVSTFASRICYYSCGFRSYLANATRIRSPPTSKRIKTSATTSAPPHLLAQQQLHPFHRVPTFEGIPIPTAPLPHQQQQQQQVQQQQQHQQQQQQASSRKRPQSPISGSSTMMATPMGSTGGAIEGDPTAMPPAPEPAPKKKGRTNTPWTAEEEQRLKTMRDAGRSWSEIAKVRSSNMALN